MPDQPNVSIESIVAPTLPKPNRKIQKLTELEEKFYTVHTAGLAQDIEERKLYALRIYRLTVAWLAVLAVFVLLHGWQNSLGLNISEKIILALITSATIQVVGLFVIVARYLFPSGITSKRK
ncbi:MAG: hypothetical protein LAO78_22450 [Acidobacteriia bacterium]|nr:hypothetical protein [Terriglobia bacterium]